jgi:hypothetical protein|tara:strand:+ start:1763 stop:1927 length:165 start_codon:yes stop_codon:yes gene_type:complete
MSSAPCEFVQAQWQFEPRYTKNKLHGRHGTNLVAKIAAKDLATAQLTTMMPFRC